MISKADEPSNQEKREWRGFVGSTSREETQRAVKTAKSRYDIDFTPREVHILAASTAASLRIMCRLLAYTAGFTPIGRQRFFEYVAKGLASAAED